MRHVVWRVTASLLLMVTLLSCHDVNDERLPAMPVNIRLDNTGVWHTYGVTGYGQYRYFILYQGIVEPADFAYPYGSATGYGGVLLISGQDAYSGEVGPLAFDLSCPVERRADVRVEVDAESLEAVCHECGSRYNVVAAGGVAVSGVAQASNYGLTRYRCVPSDNGGYLITGY